LIRIRIGETWIVCAEGCAVIEMLFSAYIIGTEMATRSFTEAHSGMIQTRRFACVMDTAKTTPVWA
jgi:hypothetical protein